MANAEYGEISAKAGRRHGVGVKGTRVAPRFGTAEESFHGRQGKADQGKGRQSGATAVAGTRSIDTYQSMGSPAHAGGAPSRGGGAKAFGQPTKVDHINSPRLTGGRQFYTGNSPAVTKGQVRSRPPGGGKKSPGKATSGRPSSRGAKPMQLAGKQTAYDGAASRRP